MRISSLKIRNYRTLENVDLTFPSLYAAICGANDSGKTNIIRAIRALVRGEVSPDVFRFSGAEDVSLKDDFPKWRDVEPSKRQIELSLTICLDAERDVGFYEFVSKQLSLQAREPTLELSIQATFSVERPGPVVKVTTGQQDYSDLDAQEVLTKLQSSKCILFHNSTELETRLMFPGRNAAGYIREITGQHEALVAKIKKTVNEGLARISKAQQTELESLLGRLQTKYRVGLSLPAFDFGYMPFSITLGDRSVEVPLEDWGSGTRNRTMVLLALFRARQIAGADPSAGKITPVMIVEEPESFLHPSAQAEFGRVLQDLADEFRVQVLVTTHSPYLLNLRDPSANILLRRRIARKQLRETEQVDTRGERWMEPFGQALGLESDEFKSWKPMFFSSADSILLVEGPIDKEYLELLRDPSHGANRLQIDAEIVPYGGAGSICNTVLLRFVKERYRRFFVTFDLDALSQVEKTLASLQLERGKQFLPIGLDAKGKRQMEGLLPDSVTSQVYGAHPGLVQAATSNSRDERESAKNSLKRLLLEEFKRQQAPGPEYFSHFYALARSLNKALSR